MSSSSKRVRAPPDHTSSVDRFGRDLSRKSQYSRREAGKGRHSPSPPETGKRAAEMQQKHRGKTSRGGDRFGSPLSSDEPNYPQSKLQKKHRVKAGADEEEYLPFAAAWGKGDRSRGEVDDHHQRGSSEEGSRSLTPAMAMEEAEDSWLLDEDEAQEVSSRLERRQGAPRKDHEEEEQGTTRVEGKRRGPQVDRGRLEPVRAKRSSGVPRADHGEEDEEEPQRVERTRGAPSTNRLNSRVDRRRAAPYPAHDEEEQPPWVERRKAASFPDRGAEEESPSVERRRAAPYPDRAEEKEPPRVERRRAAPYPDRAEEEEPPRVERRRAAPNYADRGGEVDEPQRVRWRRAAPYTEHGDEEANLRAERRRGARYTEEEEAERVPRSEKRRAAPYTNYGEDQELGSRVDRRRGVPPPDRGDWSNGGGRTSRGDRERREEVIFFFAFKW